MSAAGRLVVGDRLAHRAGVGQQPGRYLPPGRGGLALLAPLTLLEPRGADAILGLRLREALEHQLVDQSAA